MVDRVALLRRALRVARAFPEAPLRAKFRYNAREVVEYYGGRPDGAAMLARFGTDVVEPIAAMLAHPAARTVFQSLSAGSNTITDGQADS